MSDQLTTKPPTAATALMITYRLFLRGQLTRGRALGLLVLGALGVVLTAVFRTSDDPVEASTTVIAEYSLAVMIPLCALLIGASLIGDLAEDKLLVYLWLKPIPRWIVPTAAIMACFTILVPLAVVPIVIAAIVSGVSDLIVASLVASLLAVAGYSGLFVAAGARFNRALVWGLLYIVVWEQLVARISDGTARLAIRSYPASVVSRATGVDIYLADRSTAASFIVPIAVAVFAVILSTWVLGRRDID
jgi:ABC-2 type transport system permease protein